MQLVVQIRIRKACMLPILHLMLFAEPTTQSTTSVSHHDRIDPDFRAPTKVVRPTANLVVELCHNLGDVPQTHSPISQLTDAPAQLAELLDGRPTAQVGRPRPSRVLTTECVTQKSERIFRQGRPSSLLVVHRQLEPTHDLTHLRLRFASAAARADHEVVRIVDDVSVEPFLVTQLLP